VILEPGKGYWVYAKADCTLLGGPIQLDQPAGQIPSAPGVPSVTGRVVQNAMQWINRLFGNG
ncbi:MAG TPA: hypothetical protein VI874_05375, partial [Candidatus Norongarragalinales archaeon]|nr:hypothetical protein [Candidatus Norongarragalinales archaeon]